ncbi:MAG TPA: DUF4136 domain-containing protein [Anaeromyxobacter sp.]|nr:DUF4136 domain-containing protein [Anaeromyxobacter sp.]
MKLRFAALATLLLGSCYYGAPNSVLYGNPVATQYASGVNWSTYTTFSVDPTVSVVDNTGSLTQNCSVDGTNLVTTIVSEMTNRGYTQVAWVGNNTAADLQIKMSATLGSQSYYYPGYCSWYPYYYCYPGWVYAGTYSFGTIVIDMGDTLNAGPPNGGKIPLVWTAAAYGVLSSYYSGCSSPTSTIDWTKIQGIISQAFDQSPYIQK